MSQDRTQLGIVFDPCHAETYVALRGQGARLNGAALRLRGARGLGDGAVGIGYSPRVPPRSIARLVEGVLDAGGMFQRNASGALSLAHVAAGRLVGYAEAHMNAWDCLAGQLIVAEAGGRIEEQDARAMLADGGRVIAAGGPGVFDDLLRIANAAFDA